MSDLARQLRFKTAEELQAAIDAYFAECEGRTLTDNEGNPICYKGQPILVGEHPPTMTGLAYYLGFRSRQSLLNYKGRKGFLDTITRAKMRVEAYTEERLFDRNGVNGAKFSLVNNFSGWSNNPTQEQSETPENNLFARMEADLHDLREAEQKTADDPPVVENTGPV